MISLVWVEVILWLVVSIAGDNTVVGIVSTGSLGMCLSLSMGLLKVVLHGNIMVV